MGTLPHSEGKHKEEPEKHWDGVEGQLERPRRNGDKRVYYRRNTFKRHCFGVRELVQRDDP